MTFLVIRGLLFLGLALAAQGQSLREQQAAIEAALQAGNDFQALQLADQALISWPFEARLLHLRGLANFRLKRNQDAQRDLVASRKADPTDLDTAFDLGLVYMSLQRYEEAAREFQAALRDPERRTSGLPHLLLGRAYQNSNRSELALTQFQNALKAEPNLSMGHFHLGYALESIGRSAEALIEYEKELKTSPQNAEALYRYGHLLLEAGRLNDAEIQLDRAVQVNPQSADAFYDLGKVMLLQHKAAEAVIALQRSIQIDPDSSSTYFQLAKALSKTGDAAGAKAANSKFRELKAKQQTTGGMATGQIR
jgi:tetratricopeptide (TPR) repeat protein